uniref:Uncharacterized protein n=1 Tax=Erwinia amylovora TaxID=552 RepID=I1VYR6_ERWAM|nr:hypothetical protein [Erwinia amylovora]
MQIGGCAHKSKEFFKLCIILRCDWILDSFIVEHTDAIVKHKATFNPSTHSKINHFNDKFSL